MAHLFPPGFVAEYWRIQMEFDTEDKIYCSFKQCSAFIPPQTINGRDATCQECGRQTCTQCKNGSHRGKHHYEFLSPQARDLEIVSFYHSMRPRTDPSTITGKPCSSNPEDEKLKELGHRKGWMLCPRCSTMTSKKNGCDHILCTMCGTHWCYRCGSKDCDTQQCQARAIR